MVTFCTGDRMLNMDETELIKEKINIVDLISEYLPLKKTGVNFKALCPFHSEKTPSFIVSAERQIFKCFGCNRGGDIFTFLMEKEGMDFKEALEFLAKKAGVILQRRTDNKKDLRERLFEANLKAQEFFHYILTKHKLGQRALKYLKVRGLTDSSIEVFGLGYAPNSWESLTKFLIKRGFNAQEIVAAGLAVASKSSCYDRFRGRIIFPLIDAKEKLRGFSGRALSSQQPKYINTPQTAIFDKGNFLFGLNFAKGEIRTKKEAIMVEGEMDVILSHQAGFKNVVASKGTALTSGQIELMKRYCEALSLCFDMDLAGDSASKRGIEMADQAGFNIKVIRLKQGKDAAEVIKTDPKAWQQATEETLPIYDYYLASSASRFDIRNPAHLRQIRDELAPIWAKISDDLLRDHYIQKLAAFLKTDEKILRSSVEKARTGEKRNYSQVLNQKTDDVMGVVSRRELLEEYLMALLLHIPSDSNFIPSFPETLFLQETLRQIYILLVLYLDSISFKSKSFSINEFIQTLPKEQIEEVDRLYLTELDDKLADAKTWQKELTGVVSELKKALIKASLQRLSLEIKNAENFGKIETLEALTKRFRDLSLKLKNL